MYLGSWGRPERIILNRYRQNMFSCNLKCRLYSHLRIIGSEGCHMSCLLQGTTLYIANYRDCRRRWGQLGTLPRINSEDHRQIISKGMTAHISRLNSGQSSLKDKWLRIFWWWDRHRYGWGSSRHILLRCYRHRNQELWDIRQRKDGLSYQHSSWVELDSCSHRSKLYHHQKSKELLCTDSGIPLSWCLRRSCWDILLCKFCWC